MGKRINSYSVKDGEFFIAYEANRHGMYERRYLATIAEESFMLVNEKMQFACWDNGEPMIFSDKELAEEELTDMTNTSITYKGFSIMKEADYWRANGSSRLFTMGIVD